MVIALREDNGKEETVGFPAAGFDQKVAIPAVDDKGCAGEAAAPKKAEDEVKKAKDEVETEAEESGVEKSEVEE